MAENELNAAGPVGGEVVRVRRVESAVRAGRSEMSD